MPDLLADINVQGQVGYLHRLLVTGFWAGIWSDLATSVLTFQEVGLAREAKDLDVWRLCQERQMILVTANRNHEGDDSLEAAIERENTANSLPVFTLANPQRIQHSASYAEEVVVRLLDLLKDIEKYRGTGRLYLP